MKTESATIAFIGAGNMARSLMGGLLTQGYAADRIYASDPVPACLEAAAELGVINTSDDNHAIVEKADVIVLAVKPQVLADVLTPLATQLSERKPLLISIAAGVTSDSLQAWAGGGVPIVRCMPNTPALLGLGVVRRK